MSCRFCRAVEVCIWPGTVVRITYQAIKGAEATVLILVPYVLKRSGNLKHVHPQSSIATLFAFTTSHDMNYVCQIQFGHSTLPSLPLILSCASFAPRLDRRCPNSGSYKDSLSGCLTVYHRMQRRLAGFTRQTQGACFQSIRGENLGKCFRYQRRQRRGDQQ